MQTFLQTARRGVEADPAAARRNAHARQQRTPHLQGSTGGGVLSSAGPASRSRNLADRLGPATRDPRQRGADRGGTPRFQAVPRQDWYHDLVHGLHLSGLVLLAGACGATRWSRRLGGPGCDLIEAVDVAGDVWVTGTFQDSGAVCLVGYLDGARRCYAGFTDPAPTATRDAFLARRVLP